MFTTKALLQSMQSAWVARHSVIKTQFSFRLIAVLRGTWCAVQVRDMICNYLVIGVTNAYVTLTVVEQLNVSTKWCTKFRSGFILCVLRDYLLHLGLHSGGQRSLFVELNLCCSEFWLSGWVRCDFEIITMLLVCYTVYIVMNVLTIVNNI